MDVLQPWDLSLSKRLHISTITKLQEPFMHASETLKWERQLQLGISPLRRESIAASCLSRTSNLRDSLQHRVPAVAWWFLAGLKLAFMQDCPARTGSQPSKWLENVQTFTKSNHKYWIFIALGTNHTNWRYYWTFKNRLYFSSDFWWSWSGKMESVSMSLIKCDIFHFKNHCFYF